MPTENRSSNTEQMVSDNQREWLKTIADAIQHADGKPMPVDPIVADLLRALIAQPATQPLGWVYDGGQEFTSDPDLAHDLRAEGIELTAVYGHAQHQGEPVALPERKSYEESFSVHGQGQIMGWNAYHDEVAKLGPLYTHADAGEVERLRKGIAKHWKVVCDQRSELDTLRAQLQEAVNLIAEAKVLLPDYGGKKRLSAWRNAVPLFIKKIGYEKNNERTGYTLSASAEPIPFPGYPPVPEDRKLPAEPSAPVERDERADFEADQLSKGFAIDLLPGTVATYMIPAVRFAWAGWQARAALERKP